MRPRLIAAAVYIASFELLKDLLMERVKDFLSSPGMDSSEYETTVLKRHRSPLYASLDWLREMGAVDEADIASFEKIKKRRNQLAHELLNLVASDGLPPDTPALHDLMIDLVRKIETWWIRNVDLPTSPDFDGQYVEDHEIIPGPVIGLQILYNVALAEQARPQPHDADS